MIECKKTNCTIKYVGETKRILKFRLADHRGYVNNHDYTKATGEHFNSPGHSLLDLTITILEGIKSSDDLYRKEREKYFIRKFNKFYRGLNGLSLIPEGMMGYGVQMLILPRIFIGWVNTLRIQRQLFMK